MRLVTPRLQNLAKQVSGATTDGATDGALVVPGSLTPTFTFSAPWRAEQSINVTNGFGAPNTVAEETQDVNFSLSSVGANGLNSVSLGNYAPGIWRMSLWEEYFFGGGVFNGGVNDFLQVATAGGSGQMHVLRRVRAPSASLRNSYQARDLVFDVQTHWQLNISPTLAADTVSWSGGLLMQRLF